MREIKFRAWDKNLKKFHYPDLWDNSMPSNWRYWYELNQWTGLKDKNGIEIYEGDLLRIPAEDKWDEANYSSFEVFWHDNDCTPTDCGLVLGRMKNYGNIGGGYSGYKLIPRDVGRMVVIGNIHQNPELLKGA